MSEYSQASYWNDRYARDSEPFEWFQDWSSVKHLVLKYSNKNTNALVLGCGTSTIGEDFYRSGEVRSVVSVDFSSVVIDICRKRNFSNPSASSAALQWACQDVRKMDFPAEKFDFCLDKGTLDSILCSEDAELAGQKALSEVYRVLAPGGIYFLISHAPPEHREGFFKSNGLAASSPISSPSASSPSSDLWSSVQYITIPKPRLEEENSSNAAEEIHYVYIATKAKRK